MKVFISYRFTGEFPEFLHSVIDPIVAKLAELGHSSYCTLYDSLQFEEERWSGKAIMTKAFAELDSSDVVLFLVWNEDISEGLILELGYAIAKGKRIALIAKEDVGRHICLRQITDKHVYSDNIVAEIDLSEVIQ